PRREIETLDDVAQAILVVVHDFLGAVCVGPKLALRLRDEFSASGKADLNPTINNAVPSEQRSHFVNRVCAVGIDSRKAGEYRRSSAGRAGLEYVLLRDVRHARADDQIPAS